MFPLKAEETVDGAELTDQIAEATRDNGPAGPARAAALCAEAVARFPDREDLRLKEIEALQSGCAWAAADERAALAASLFPHSLPIALAFARNPYLACDWQQATERFVKLRAAFDPSQHFGAAQTILDEFYCRERMMDKLGAAVIVSKHWSVIKKYSANMYGWRSEIFEIRNFIPAAQMLDYVNWSLQAVPAPELAGYARRIEAIVRNRQWIRREAPDVEIVSLGHGALPWMLPNRWGLRPGSVNMSPFGPFDYLAMAADVPAELLESDFENLLNPKHLVTVLVPGEKPALVHQLHAANFFHEQGPWWAKNDWARLHYAYRGRTDRFRRGVRNGKRVYFYCLAGPGDLARLVKAYEDRLDDPNARLLAVSVLKQPPGVAAPSRRVAIRHIPFPDDYNWTMPGDFDSPRGQALELEIVKAICDLLLTFQG